MKAMLLETPGRPLVERNLPRPRIGPSQVLLRVRACAVCRTDLHILDGELPEARLPLVPDIRSWERLPAAVQGSGV